MATEKPKRRKVQKPPTLEELRNTVITIDGVRWYTYKQIAAIYEVTPQTVFNWYKAGRLKKTQHLGVNLYREIDADEPR